MGTPWTRRTFQITTRESDTLPQTTDEALFSITGGKVRIISIVGEVTTVIQNQANNTKLKHNPDGTGSDVDLCAVLSIANDAVRTLYSITGTLATAMKSTTLGVVAPADNIAYPGLILDAGDIELDCAASNTGEIKWTINWVPVDPGANIAAA